MTTSQFTLACISPQRPNAAVRRVWPPLGWGVEVSPFPACLRGRSDRDANGTPLCGFGEGAASTCVRLGGSPGRCPSYHLRDPPSLAVSEAAQLCPTLCDPVDCRSPGSSVHGILQARITGVGCHFLLQGFFPTQGSNSGLPHCRPTFYPLSHQGSQSL